MFLVDHEVGHRTGLAEKEARRPRVIGVLGDVTITVGVDDQASQAKLSTARALPCSARSPHSSHDCRVLILRQTFLLTVGFDADILVLSASVKRGLADIGTRLLTICEPRRDRTTKLPASLVRRRAPSDRRQRPAELGCPGVLCGPGGWR